ncbi:PIR protein [Plasmodium malariae]|uniref:PIR protein n=1 Tax=Plasmodium malariae TaxID=5858 RepID=A0A1C3KXX5_PLAMA|nr:PIR protein [Plasmodium malariae]
MLGCPHYFLKCDNVFDPSMLLSELEKKDGGSCDVLQNKSESESIEKISDPKNAESDIMETFLFTNCHIKNDRKFLSCAFVQASALRDRNRDTNEIHEQSENNSIDSLKTQTSKKGYDSENVPETGTYKSKIVHSDVDGKDELSDYYEDVDKLIKWKFSEGNPICSGNPSNKDTVKLCKYMEQVHKVGLAKKKDGGGYEVKSGVSWSAKDLKIGREKEKTRE